MTDDVSQSPSTEPTLEQIKKNLLRANEVAKKVMEEGRHPFGAILVADDHETVLMEQGNIDTVNHAESTLARRAAEVYSPEKLWGYTLYTTCEPCAMCAGTQYWANIGRLVFGMTEHQLMDFTGAHEENPTMNVPCRYVFENSQKEIKVIGPVEEVIGDIAELHRNFWS
jgi:tRNA(Arg) A34 adenosine deaminase TadA